MELRDHQEEALNRLSNGKILWGGVGTGKSFTAVKYYERREAPRDVYVITTAKKRDSHDWEQEFAHIGVGTEHSVLGRLVVDSWNNLQRYINTTGAFFIFDEQRLVGSGAWVKAFIKLARRNHWILLSATPGDTWMDYVPVFVANGWYSNRTDFKREHVVYNTFAKFPKIDRYVGTAKLARYRREVLVEMPYVRETLRNLVYVDIPYDAELLQRVTKDRWNVYENRPLKDIGELYRVARRVVNSDPRRLAKVAELVRTHPKLIIFYNFDYELELLRSLWTNQKRNDASENTPRSTARVGESYSPSRASSSAPAVGGKLWLPKNSSRSTSKDNVEESSSSSSSGDRHISTAAVELGRSELWMPTPSSTNTMNTGSSAPLSSQTGFSECGVVTAESYGHSKPIRSESWTNRKNRSSSGLLETSGKGSRSGLLNPELRSSGNTSLTEQSSSFQMAESVALAEWNGHKHQRIPLEHDRWVYLVQYTAGAEGWNCTETDTMIFYSWNYSYKIWHQSQGRIDRLNTPYRHLTYYVLGGKSWIDLAIRKSLSQKQDFQERAI